MVNLRPGYLRGIPRFLTPARARQYRQGQQDLLLFTKGHFLDAFDGLAVGVTLISMQGRILDVNPALQQILRSTAAELRGKCVTDLTHPEDLALARRLFWQLLAGELDHYRLQKRYLRGDGSTGEAVVTVALVRDRSGQPRHLLGILDDLSTPALPPSPPRRTVGSGGLLGVEQAPRRVSDTRDAA